MPEHRFLYLKKARHFLFLSVGVTFLNSLNIYFFFNIINIYKMRMTILYTVIHFPQ